MNNATRLGGSHLMATVETEGTLQSTISIMAKSRLKRRKIHIELEIYKLIVVIAVLHSGVSEYNINVKIV